MSCYPLLTTSHDEVVLHYGTIISTMRLISFIDADSLMSMQSHQQRNLIWQELHARPYVRFSAPAHIFHFTFLTGEGTEAADQASLARLKETMGLKTAYETARHAIYTASVVGLGRLVLAWERHSEFVAYTFFLYELEIPFQPFGLDFRELLPPGFPDSIGVPLLVATRVSIGSSSEMPDTPEGLTDLFEGHTVNGSKVMAGRAKAWSCYRVHEDGLGRIALVVNPMSPHSLGRTVQRLLAIEDLYHLTLLSLPVARELKADLASWESRVVIEMEALRVADSVEQKRAVLNSFLGLAADIESLRARVSNRFNGSAAYFSLLESRFVELREEKIEHVLRLSRFIMRRLAPAEQTIRSVLERLTNMSQRIDRAAELLRTSIELHVEEQNQRLLADADRRARLQLEFQNAVEGLTVVVITYYALGLMGYVLKGANHLGLKIDVDLALGGAALILLLAAWGLMHRIRKRFRD
ncbi:MAG: DUF3422 domain-containing protein [Acidobacteriota bacterium]|nr:DUF3422 domain-containing protein [Acidobacteriota bacterium]